jgi:tripartite-type tricarboxylate transporter receptor subunit TctC
MVVVVFLRWVLFLACVSGIAAAQTYPVKPVRVVTNEPGGGLDFALRVMTHALSAGLGQPVIVDNRGGGGGRTRAVNRGPACGM